MPSTRSAWSGWRSCSSATGPGLAGEWLMIKITPGAATPVKETPLPVEPEAGVPAMALSGSGQQLAVLIDAGKPESRSLCVYSTADGREQRCWQTTDLSTVYLGPTSYLPGRLYAALTWIDDDRRWRSEP